MPRFLSACSRPRLPSQTDAVQPGCVRPRPAAVPPAAHRPAAAQSAASADRLPVPASVQPGLQRLMDHSATLLATLNMPQHFQTWQD